MDGCPSSAPAAAWTGIRLAGCRATALFIFSYAVTCRNNVWRRDSARENKISDDLGADMAMNLYTNELGDLELDQSLIRPVVYLDHWAVRRLSDDQPLQDRFVAALKKKAGTLLFSSQNLAEFCKVEDIDTARRAEVLLGRVLPDLYVADFTIDKGFATAEGGPAGVDSPGEGWLVKEMVERAKLDPNSELTVHRFVTDVVTHRDALLPVFVDMEAGIAAAINTSRQNPEVRDRARRYRPQPGETLQMIVQNELTREYYLDPASNFGPNDASDMVHAVASLIRADFALLDHAWCVKADRACRRLHGHRINRRLAQTFSGKANGLGEFFSQLESWAAPR